MRMLKVLAVGAFILATILILHNGPKQRAPKYNAATEVRIAGVIQDIQYYWCPINGDKGTHLMVKTNNGMLEVHVAPLRFLQGNGVSFRKGDQIDVVGSMVMFEGHDAMIARKITRGNETFAFRQANGRPLWVEPVRTFVR